MNTTNQMDIHALAAAFMDVRAEMIAVAAKALAAFPKVQPSEVVQEAYMRAARNPADFDKTAFRSAFRRIVDQVVSEERIKHANDDNGVDIDLTGTKEDSKIRLAPVDPYAQLHRAMEDMSEEERQILNLRHFKGFNNIACATQLKISSKRAQELYARALMTLKEKLGPNAFRG